MLDFLKLKPIYNKVRKYVIEMSDNWLKIALLESIREGLNESWYTNTATPYFSKAEVNRELGRNPLRTDVGKHSPREEVRQPSTFDRNGSNFKGEHIVVSDNRFNIYKIKNFGKLEIDGTLAFFGRGATGEKELRRAIDTLNGAADRNGRTLSYRTITSESGQNISQKTNYMKDTFWEFSFNGIEWYILKPNPVQSLKLSKFIKK